MLGKISQKNVFCNILEGRNALMTIKTRRLKSRKMGIFSKGLVHRCGRKLVIFQIFILGKIGQKNVFYDIVEERNAFLDYKNKKLKKSKNWDFSKGVSPWF